jgi:hypothetical protein
MPRRPPEVAASTDHCGGCCHHAVVGFITGRGLGGMWVYLRAPRTWRGLHRSFGLAISV